MECNRIFTGAQRGRLYDLHGIGSPATDDQFRLTLHIWWGQAGVEPLPIRNAFTARLHTTRG